MRKPEWMTPAPGSVLWLLKYELRLHLRSTKLGRWRNSVVFVLVLGACLYHVPAIVAARFLSGHALPLPEVLLAATILLAFASMLMFSQSLKTAVESLYERSDLDWLITTPIPLRRVLTARMVGIAVSVVWPWLLFGGPMVNAMAISGHPEMLALYPVLCCAALVMASAGSMVTIALMAWLGLRRTRAIALAIAMLTAASALAISQMRVLLTPQMRLAVFHAIRPHCCGMPSGPQWWPARALIGDPVPFAVALLCGIGAAVLAGAFLERRFLSSAMAVASATRSGARRRETEATRHFHGSLGRVMLRKELRTMLRAPGIIGRSAYPLIYLLPLTVIIMRGSLQSALLGLGSIPVFLTGELARLFMTTSVTADVAGDLALSAPIPARAIRIAKLRATCICVFVIAGLPILAIGVLVPPLIAPMMVGVVGVTISEIMIGLWKAPPGRRQDLGSQHQGLSVLGAIGTIISGLWSTTASVALLHSPWAAVPAILAISLLLVVRPRTPEPQPPALAIPAQPVLG